jgi:N-acetylmuramoyl-L-alanine amidase
VTFHYTAGPASGSAWSTAAYQTSEAARKQTGAGTPFPGLAYTLFIEADGEVVLAHSLEVRVWHSAAIVSGRGRNYSHVGVCYAGNHAPNADQVVGMASAVVWLEQLLDRELALEGHGWLYATSCPGPTSRGWISSIERLAQP